ncbi:hypothetical protein BS17DRAFT_791567 [Gyrodon lividus]|nr:hypothetical protein BS17DRAFT_791567 [Gyrodon lividus]
MALLTMTIMEGPLCGTLATMMLYGVVCLQTFYYALNYSTDRKAIKWLVGSLWILETAHSTFSIHFIEYYLILNYGNPLALNRVIWSVGATYIIGFLVAWIVDIFFVWRIWRLSNKIWICVFLTMLETIRIGAGIGACIIGLRYTAISIFFTKLHPIMIAACILAAFSNTLIALTLCYYLRRWRGGMKRTQHVIDRLLVYTINTGALTSLFAILSVTIYVALSPSTVFTAFGQVESTFYAISLLASLNSRKATLEGDRWTVPAASDGSLEFLTRIRNGVRCSTQPRIEITGNVDTDVHAYEQSFQGSHGTTLV